MLSINPLREWEKLWNIIFYVYYDDDGFAFFYNLTHSTTNNIRTSTFNILTSATVKWDCFFRFYNKQDEIFFVSSLLVFYFGSKNIIMMLGCVVWWVEVLFLLLFFHTIPHVFVVVIVYREERRELLWWKVISFNSWCLSFIFLMLSINDEYKNKFKLITSYSIRSKSSPRVK